MQPYLSRAKFAKLCGVTKQAISLAVQKERVHLTERRVDPKHPTNQYYREQVQARKAPSPGIATEKLPTPGPKANRRQVSKTDTSASGAGLTRKQLDIDGLDADGGERIYGHQITAAKTLAQARKLQMENDAARGKLIDRGLVSDFMAKLYSIEATEFGTLSDKLSAEIAGRLGVDNAADVIAAGKIIEREIRKTLEHIEVAVDRFLKALPIDGAT